MRLSWFSVVIVLLTCTFALEGQQDSSNRTGTAAQTNVVPSKKLLSEVRNAPERRAGISWVDYIDNLACVASVIRRTAPGKSELHRGVVDIWYIAEGGGTLVTGGTLSRPIEDLANDVQWQQDANQGNELRGQGISGGTQRHIGKGDFVVIPADTPHWLKRVDREIIYLAIKVPPGENTVASPGSSVSVSNAAMASEVQRVLAVDDARRVAMLHGDVAALTDLLADDVTIFWGDGTQDDKASTLEQFRSGRLHYSRSDYGERHVRLYGETAIVTGDARVTLQVDGKDQEHTGNVTRVYVRQQGQWRAVAIQTTRTQAQ